MQQPCSPFEALFLSMLPTHGSRLSPLAQYIWTWSWKKNNRFVKCLAEQNQVQYQRVSVLGIHFRFHLRYSFDNGMSPQKQHKCVAIPAAFAHKFWSTSVEPASRVQDQVQQKRVTVTNPGRLRATSCCKTCHHRVCCVSCIIFAQKKRRLKISEIHFR